MICPICQDLGFIHSLDGSITKCQCRIKLDLQQFMARMPKPASPYVILTDPLYKFESAIFPYRNDIVASLYFSIAASYPHSDDLGPMLYSSDGSITNFSPQYHFP